MNDLAPRLWNLVGGLFFSQILQGHKSMQTFRGIRVLGLLCAVAILGVWVVTRVAHRDQPVAATASSTAVLTTGTLWTPVMTSSTPELDPRQALEPSSQGPCKLSIHVTNRETGAPVERMRATLSAVGEGAGQPLLAEARSVRAPEGRFASFLAPAGLWRVQIDAVGFERAVLEVRLPKAGGALEIEMTPHASLVGTVSDPAGEPLGGLLVRLLPEGVGSPGPRLGNPFGCTDARGRFLFADVPPGEYVVAVSEDGRGFEHAQTHAVREGRSTRCDFTLETRACFLCRVRDRRGAPFAGAWVSLRSVGSETAAALTLSTDAEGVVRGRFLEPGPYDLEVRAAGCEDTREQVDLVPGRNLVVVEVRSP